MGYIQIDGDALEIGRALADWSESDWSLISELHEPDVIAT